jgi:long-chain acyl-CoA synthetase
MFLDRVAATPDAEAFRHPTTGGWQSVTWRQTGERVRALAAGLLSLGIAAEERAAIISGTRYEWVLADFAIMCAGAATTTVYPTTPADDVAFILADSGSRIAFAENDGQVEKLREYREKLPELQQVVTFDGTPDDDWVLSLDQLERRGREHLSTLPDIVDATVEEIGPESLATLIYTSGTTGRPKGVRLVHDNWTYEGKAIEALNLLYPDDVQYLWLPLSHSFGKVLLSGQLAVGFASAVDGDVTKLVEQLGVVRPTFMAGAPRIFEKVQHRVTSMVEEEGGVRAKIFHWAYGVGRQVSAAQRAGQQVNPVLKVQHAVADRLVFNKLRGRFGGRVRYFISGSAALSDKVAEFFHAAGLLILEGYGLTETGAGSFVNRPNNYRFGTVGWPLPGTDVSIADDGEILVHGPGVMRGYHNLPKETEEALTDDGWFRTGDMGELDDQGFLRITDRKKDLIKTSGGKYVAPQAIEVMFKAMCPYASAIVVHGDGRNYCTALIALDPEAIEQWAEQHGASGASYEDLSRRDDVRAMLQDYVDEMNARLPRWETIKKFAILPEDLTVESGGLTPSMKVRRRVVEKQYATVLDAFYEEEPAPANR